MKMKYRELLNNLQNQIDYKPTHEEIAKVLQKSNINVTANALSNRLYNDGFIKPEELQILEKHYAFSKLLFGADDNITLDFYPDVFGSCGSGSMVFSETSEKIAVTKELITNYSASNKYSVISARGSSMSPVINDDDKLVIQHDVNGQIIDDTVYLFRYNDELFIKRLVKNVDQIVCISENPRFQDRIIEPNGDNFSIIGKVVGLFRSKV